MPDDQRRRESRQPTAKRRTTRSPLTAVDGDGKQPNGRGGGGGNGRGELGQSLEPQPDARRRRRPSRPRVNRLRLGVILAGLGVLALISTVFGMLMAVAQDLPSLEATNEFKASKNTTLTDAHGKYLATLTGKENRILVGSGDISSSVKHAVISIEDERFFRHKGLDYQAIARALWADIRRQGAVQGGSTITQQFVKNALVAQTNRSIFQKLKEAALAYQLERKWTKDKILTQYLNTVYFGAGAYGIESAARVYFGYAHPGCEPRCAAVLDTAEAAMLAGVIASPSAYSPIQNPAGAVRRRNIVLDRMHQLQLIGDEQFATARVRALPAQSEIRPPRKISKSPYFTAWVEQQLVDRYGTGAAFGGGLKVRTTLDLDLQAAAEQAVGRISGVGPSAALVALDNKTGAVRAIVGGPDFDKRPFNLATQGRRQPGSAFKPFTLVTAIDKGISPGRTFVSAKKTIDGPRGPFKVENYEDRYLGTASLATATTVSDNSVYAEVGYKLVGTKAVARTARRMGIRTRLSTNPAMVLGGLRVGVTPMEMADSYLTLAHGGSHVSGTLAAYDDGPVAFTRVKGRGLDDENDVRTDRVVDQSVADQTTQILQTVVSSGTGRAAATGQFAAGKTGTTENYQDAWFVGYDDTLTIAVWVGYPEGGRAMETEYRGEPVAGGTYPAEIWREFVMAADRIRQARTEARGAGDEEQLPPAGIPTTPAVTPEGNAAPTDERGPSRRKQRQKAPAREEKQTDASPPPETPAQPPTDQTPPADETPPPPESGGAGDGTGGTGGQP